MDKDKIYNTTSLNLAAFLHIKGFELIDIKDEGKDGKKVFVFKHSDDIERVARVFYFGENDNPELMVNARNLLGLFKELKNKLYSLD
jgi:hypothetical protein